MANMKFRVALGSRYSDVHFVTHDGLLKDAIQFATRFNIPIYIETEEQEESGKEK